MRISIRILSAGAALAALLPSGVAAQRGGFGGPMQQERKILAQFDKNGDKRLDAAERKSAREWLATQPAGGFGGRRGGPFANAAAPEPGRKLAPAAKLAFVSVECPPTSRPIAAASLSLEMTRRRSRPGPWREALC